MTGPSDSSVQVEAERARFIAEFKPREPLWQFQDDGTGGFHNQCTEWAWIGWQAARRAALSDADRELMKKTLAAMSEISVMYAHTWDRVEDGALLMMPLSIPRFEAAHEQVKTAIAALRTRLLRHSEGKE